MQDNYEIQSSDTQKEEQEIDLIELGLKLWNSRKRILIWTGLGALLGIIVALSIPKEYEATVKLVPEMGDSGRRNSLSALASFAGINTNNTTDRDAVYPILYPDVISSTPFVTELFDVELPMSTTPGDTLSLSEIITEKTKGPWWGVIMGIPGKLIGGIKGIFNSSENISVSDSQTSVDPFKLTREQAAIAGAIRSRINADVDNKTTVLTLTVTLQDPLAAATLADTITEKLHAYITDYRTGKARNDLEYAIKINDEAREAYYEAQQRYANYVDRNHSLSNQSANIERERLQNEAALAFSLYNTTSQQVQQAEAKVQSYKPVFTIVNPASVPIIPSKPRKMMILIAFVFLAFVAASAYILFGPGLISSIKEKKSNLKNSNIND